MIGCWVVHTFGVLGHVAFKNCTCKLDKIYIFYKLAIALKTLHKILQHTNFNNFLPLPTSFTLTFVNYLLQQSTLEQLWKFLHPRKKFLHSLKLWFSLFYIISMFMCKNVFLYHGKGSILWNIFLTHLLQNMISTSQWFWNHV